MRPAAALLALWLAAPGFAATLRVDFQDAGSRAVTLETAIDDAHLQNPAGYFPADPPAARVVRRIVIENTGTAPIEDPDIRLNGRPLLPTGDALAALEVDDARDLLGLFFKWQDRAVHGLTDLDANRDPLALLHVFGAGLCGDDARALAAVTVSHGARARFARLNGHSVAEHRLGGDWVLLDGDQNLFYLDWDNETPLGEAAILGDPLLALRTQVYGRQGTWELAPAWQNTSRFEFVDRSRGQKEFRLKNVPPTRHWQLLPREKLVIDLERAPRQVLAANEKLRANPILAAVVCAVEFHAARPAGTKLALPFPALGNPEPKYEVEMADALVVECQAARAQFPLLRRGRNEISWTGRGNLRVAFEIEPPEIAPAPAPRVAASEGLPRFEVVAPGADRLWWQISPREDFRFVPPNFDRVEKFRADLALDQPIDHTFFSPGRAYFFRAKVRRGGAWSDWCAPVRFTVRKPERPRIERVEAVDAERARITWKAGAGEVMIFGSNRLDFLPEVYGDAEVVRMENGAIREKRANRNLLAIVPAEKGEATVPLRACYRLVARDGAALSVPSALHRVAGGPQARVLQNRNDGARDVAVEMDAP